MNRANAEGRVGPVSDRPRTTWAGGAGLSRARPVGDRTYTVLMTSDFG
jgi:hypothetical protein